MHCSQACVFLLQSRVSFKIQLIDGPLRERFTNESESLSSGLFTIITPMLFAVRGQGEPEAELTHCTKEERKRFFHSDHCVHVKFWIKT